MNTAREEISLLLASICALENQVDAARVASDKIKRQLLLNNFMLAASSLPARVVTRKMWTLVRNERWFEDTVPGLGDQIFKQSYRVSPSTFRFIVERLRPALERTVTNMREPIPVDKVVAIALYKLCSSAEDRTVAHVFAVGRSTVNGIYREFCDAVIAVLERDWLQMMTADEMENHIREFQAVCDFPQGVGALDGCHFPVSPPKDDATDYHNYKGWYSIILMALVDHKYRFRYISVGAPGRCHDAHVYRRSQLSHIVASPLLQAPVALVAGTAVPLVILCDQAFPLTANLIKPFGHNTTLTDDQRNFNYHLSRARSIVENAFGRLKARFRYTARRMDCDVNNARLVIRTCCILNNICEYFSDDVPQQWLTELQQDNVVFPQPSYTTGAAVGEGSSVRSALVEYYRQRN
ncbi:uncharacterized protein LOC135384383 [Ornithodoros turicata]|uniref:uncharacterized protein LOC135384383 n=1 Tax=Ornithodoros turicata TaxID=34597 RepID=UPI0031389294